MTPSNPTVPKTHWVVRINYRTRSVSWALVFVAMLLHGMAQMHSPWTMVLDALAFGVWSAVLEFPLWITFSLWISAVMGLSAFRGPPGALIASAAMVAGSVLVVIWNGVRFSPQTDLLVTLMCMASLALYLFLFSLDANRRALVLRAIRHKLMQSETEL